MTIIDIIILLLAIGGGLTGWRKGITGQLASVGGVLLSIILCRWFGNDLALALGKLCDTPESAMFHTVLAYVLLCTVAYIGVRVIARFAGMVFKTLHLSILNRVSGAAFGAIEWLLGFSLLLNLWVAVFPDTKIHTKNTDVTDFVMSISPVVLGSETLHKVLELKDAKRPDILTPRFTAETDSVETADMQ